MTPSSTASITAVPTRLPTPISPMITTGGVPSWARTIAPGTFGDNLTIEGVEGRNVCVGDRFAIGDVVLEVTSHRTPCMTLAARMDDPGFVRRFHKANRPGAYFRVIAPGPVSAGDDIDYQRFAGEQVSVAELMALDGVARHCPCHPAPRPRRARSTTRCARISNSASPASSERASMSLDSVRADLASRAPDLAVIETEGSTATVQLAAEVHGVEPGQIAKTLCIRVNGEVLLLVTRGDARLDNKKAKAAFGGRPRMLGAEEVEALTSHKVGGVCPFGLPQRLPIFWMHRCGFMTS